MNYKINISVYVQLAITNPHEFYTCTHMSASAHACARMCTHPHTHVHTPTHTQRERLLTKYIYRN